MTEMRVRKRHRLRQKEIASISGEINSVLGATSFDENDVVDMAEAPDFDLVYVNGKVLAFVVKGRPFLTVRGLLAYRATKRYVSVDMGAIRFVYNGADVMGPGIVEADQSFSEGDLVWVRDVKNQQPLAVGRAVVGPAVMASKVKGVAVKSIHHVGDKLWLLDEPKKDEHEAERPDAPITM